MDYVSILNNLLDYYSNLLIIQYNGKPRAKETIKMIANFILANLLIFQIRDGFDWKTAVGAQLDIIGKWVGISRSYNQNNTWDKTYLSYPAYGTFTTAESDTQRGGYCDYSTFNDDDGGMLTYKDLQNNSQELEDEDYRTIIGLKIIKNSIIHNQGNIDEAVALYFAEKDADGNVIYTDFDLSKFTVVGSPTITADGIASGFSSSNFLDTPSIALGAGDWDITIPVKFTSAMSSYTNGRVLAQQGDKIRIMPYNGNCAIAVIASDDSYIINSSFTPTLNDEYLINIYKSGTTYCTQRSSDNGKTWTNISTVTSSKTIYTTTSAVMGIGRNFAGGDVEIDLKKVKITVDGQEVFNGVGYHHILNPIVYTTWQTHEITYHYPASLNTIMNICLYKNVLPAPTGVSIQLSSY